MQKDNLVILPQVLRLKRTEAEKRRRHIHGDAGAKFSQSKYYEPSTGGCSNTISTVTKDNMIMEATKPRPNGEGWHWNEEANKWVRYRIRKLTPRECFRLMDVADKNIDKIQSAGISESQQYKLAGNSIVVNCLYLIFKNLFIENEKPDGLLF